MAHRGDSYLSFRSHQGRQVSRWLIVMNFMLYATARAKSAINKTEKHSVVLDVLN